MDIFKIIVMWGVGNRELGVDDGLIRISNYQTQNKHEALILQMEGLGTGDLGLETWITPTLVIEL